MLIMKKQLTLVALLAMTVCAKADPLMTDSVHSLESVVITGTRSVADVRHLPMTVTIIDRDKLTENNRTNILPTVMESVPGLMVTSRGMLGYGVSTGGSGGMLLRGLSSAAGQMMVLIDGHPQYQGIYGHSISDSYGTMMAERVEVLRGPASLLYGSNAMGGVVNIVTRSMKENGMKTHATAAAGSYGTVQTAVSNQFRKDRFSSTVAAQYERSDNHRDNMGFEQFGGYAKVNYRLSDHLNVYADADVIHFNASNPGTVAAPLLENDQYITRGVVSLALENHFGATSGAVSIYDNFGRHKINDGYAPGATPQVRLFRSKDALRGISAYESTSFFEGNRVTAGIDVQQIYGHAYYTSRATGEVLDPPAPSKQSAEEDNMETALYVDVRQDLADWVTVDAGIRYDNHTVTGDEWIPQAGLVLRPMSNGALKAMASKGFRNPTMREMYLYPPSNTDLLPESMWNYELSWKHDLLAGRLSYGVNVFYIKADNLIVTNYAIKRNENTGELENKGVEAELEYRINGDWSLNTNHSYLDMKKPVAGAPTYKGYLGVNYRHDALSVNAGLQQVCGLYTVTGSEEGKEDFTLLGATVAYQLRDGVQLWVRGDNLLDQEYQINAGYPMPGANFMAGVNLSF